MPDTALKPSGIYRFTSIARPVDPRYPTNRAVLILLPILALASAGMAAVLDLNGSMLSAAFGTLLTGFAAWALTRELAPDDDAAAFLALALSWPAHLFLGASSVLLPFVALFLVRIVNRSTGPMARPFDTVAILGFTIWAAISLGQHLILLLAAAAFSLNATLRDPQRNHLLAAAVCLAVFGWLVAGAFPLTFGYVGLQDWWIVLLLAGANILVLAQAGEPASVCDVFSERLDKKRVAAGLVLGFLVAFQALITEGRAAWLETPIWACLVAVPVSLLARRLWKWGHS
ncbi:MAG: hypothetical protein KJO31_09780 [Gammaproteobacteria bacterium]|nr:hypothetical protein [Gammaproteobacteria bacterium]